MSEVKQAPKQKVVKVTLRVTETPDPLPGTAAWVLKQIESGYLKVGCTKNNQPGVWLHFGKDQKQSEILAIYDKNYQNKPRFDRFPLEQSFYDQSMHDALGVTLTPAGLAVLKQLGKKALILLKMHLRRNDRKATGKLFATVQIKND